MHEYDLVPTRDPALFSAKEHKTPQPLLEADAYLRPG